MEFKNIHVSKKSDYTPVRSVDVLEIDGYGCVLIVSDRYENGVGCVTSTSQSMSLIPGVFVCEEKDENGEVTKRYLKKK